MIDFSQIPSPCYVIEDQLLRKNLTLLKYVQEQAGIEIICALKGFSMYSTFPMVRQYLAGATASSLNEARLCFEEMKAKAHVYAPAYLEREFDELMSYSSHITFNSLNQYNTFGEEHVPMVLAAVCVSILNTLRLRQICIIHVLLVLDWELLVIN
jgi:carboxynorspermidine decarboxylase